MINITSEIVYQFTETMQAWTPKIASFEIYIHRYEMAEITLKCYTYKAKRFDFAFIFSIFERGPINNSD